MVKEANLEIYYEKENGDIYVYDPHISQFYRCLLLEEYLSDTIVNKLIPIARFSTENPENKSLLNRR
jgi:hypothetical protein